MQAFLLAALSLIIYIRVSFAQLLGLADKPKYGLYVSRNHSRYIISLWTLNVDRIVVKSVALQNS